jgi:hypothetical protein
VRGVRPADGLAQALGEELERGEVLLGRVPQAGPACVTSRLFSAIN